MRYQHALCLYPYLVDQRPGIGIFPPTGLEYVATALKGLVGRISLIDRRKERSFRTIEQLRAFIERENVDLICISIGWRARYDTICTFVAQLPTGIDTIVGGYEATEQVEDIFHRCPNVNGIVRGEGEQTIAAIANGESWDRVTGLSYRDASGAIHHNENRPLAPIDQIVPPDRALRRSRYSPTLRGVRLMNTQFDTILSSRGCPYKCEFCSLVINPLGQLRGYVARSPESIADEIESSPADIIMFADDIFFLEPKKSERLAEVLIQRGIKKRYIVQCRIEVYKFPRMLQKAWDAGFRVLLFGIESASDKILKAMHKGFTTEKARAAFNVLRRFPFWFHGYFIYGSIGETKEEMLAIPQFARDLGLHSISLSLLRMDKFTPWKETVKNTPGYRIGTNGYVYSEQFDKARLRRIRNRIRNDFQYRPAQMLKMIRTANECDIVSYKDMLRVIAHSPIFGVDYLDHRLTKWHRRAGRPEPTYTYQPADSARPTAEGIPQSPDSPTTGSPKSDMELVHAGA